MWTGAFAVNPVNDEMMHAFGDPAPSEVAIFPVSVKRRVVAFLVGDIPGSEVSPDEREQLMAVARKAGIAFEILIMKKKISV